METDAAAAGDAGTARFLNFLRGMETPLRDRARKALRSFLNFLRGMETTNLRAHLSDQRSS